MSNYMLFAALLTVAYIIYYGYHIGKDLYGKKKDAEPEAETFDISDMGMPPPAQVELYAGPLPEPPTVAASPLEEGEAGAKPKASKAMEEGLEEAQAESEGAVAGEELELMMLQRDPRLAFKPAIRQSRECV